MTFRNLAALFMFAVGTPHLAAAASTFKKIEIEWIDTHVHPIGPGEGAVAEIISSMQGAGIVASILLPPPQSPEQPGRNEYPVFKSAVEKHAGRLYWLGGGRILNGMIQAYGNRGEVPPGVRLEFERCAMEILEAGAAGFGEITAHHYSYRPDHPYESVPADSPLLLLLADIAAKHDAVIDFHFDPVARRTSLPAWMSSPSNPRTLESNLGAFERLLAHNPKAKFVWAHMGSDPLGHWTAKLCRDLLQRNPNLNMSIRLGQPFPGQVFDPAFRIGGEWLQLFHDFPDRFVIGGDQFIMSPDFSGGGPGRAFSQYAELTRNNTRAFLAKLPIDLRRKIATDNAKHLYKINKAKSEESGSSRGGVAGANTP